MTTQHHDPCNTSRRGLLKFAAATAAATAMGGCGGDSIGGSGEVELQFMFWGSAFEKSALEEMLQKFEQEHSGIATRPIHVPGDYETKVNTLVASDSMPDVAFMPTPTAYRLAEQGKIVNIYPYIEKYDQLSGREPGDFFWYGEEEVAGTPGASEITLLWYNRDMITDPSLKPPASADTAWSWDDLVEVATQLTFDQDGNHPTDSGFDAGSVRQFGISAPLTNHWTWYPLLRSNGADVADESGTKCTINSPEAVEVFQNLQDLVYTHRVSPSPAQLGGADGSNAPSTTVLLQTKRVAIVFDGQWTLLDLGQSDLNYSLGVLPSYQEPATQEGGGCRIVSANTEHLDEAMDLYVYSVDGSNSDLFQKGLWMPVETRYYEDEEAIRSWIDNDVHPAEYRTAAVDYRLNCSVRDWTLVYKNAVELQEVITPAMQEIATGSAPAKEVLDRLAEKVQPRLEGKYVIPSTL